MTRHTTVPARPLLRSMMMRRAINGARRLGEGWAALHCTLALWQRRARTRAELDLIPRHRLKDLPHEISTILNERRKPLTAARSSRRSSRPSSIVANTGVDRAHVQPGRGFRIVEELNRGLGGRIERRFGQRVRGRP